MTPFNWLQSSSFVLFIVVVTKPLGLYMHRIFEGTPPCPTTLGRVEAVLYKLCGVDPRREQTWSDYAAALLLFSTLGLLVTFAVQVLQARLPLNPQGLPGVDATLAFNTAASFVSNTNWQAYVPERTVSYFTQMTVLTWQNFVSAASGIGVALALARGLTRRDPQSRTLGNFWVDVIRSLVYLLIPLCVIFAVVLVSQGVLQTLAPYRELTTIEGLTQHIALGPVASQEAIKMLGTNGGGFFNANSAHPFENPTPLSNFIEMCLIFAIPAGLTYTFGRMARDTKQGWAIFGAMLLLFVAGLAVATWAELQPPIAQQANHIAAGAGNLEGKEVRLGAAASALFATVTTGASCGAVNAMHDSFTPLGGLVPLLNIQLGEVVFGGVGAGLYGVLIFVVLSVFIAGLMVGRTPEYLGKKIEPREMKLAVLYILIFPLFVLGFTGWSAVAPYGTASLGNLGPHGLSEMLYAYTSGVGNNGSAFAGLSANTPWYNVTLGLTMLAGRFLMMLPVLALGGAMVQKRVVPAGPGTFPTHGLLFTGLLVAVIIIVGALTFFPALSLSAVLEHFLALAGKVN